MELIKTETSWKDARGNECEFAHFGGEDKAKAALESLVNCRDCFNCCYCRDCHDCGDCRDCSDCRSCRSCRSCSYCRSCRSCRSCCYCLNCGYCSDCFNRSSCSDKSGDIPTAKIENIHTKVYAAATSASNALNMSDWHTCETTHCRAGWVVHLAGKEGYALEESTNTCFAAMQIYKASGYQINPCRFYDSKINALADMKRLAELEQQGEEE